MDNVFNWSIVFSRLISSLSSGTKRSLQGQGFHQLPRLPPVLEETWICQIFEVSDDKLFLRNDLLYIFCISQIPEVVKRKLIQLYSLDTQCVSISLSSCNTNTSDESCRAPTAVSSSKTRCFSIGSTTPERGRDFFSKQTPTLRAVRMRIKINCQSVGNFNELESKLTLFIIFY